MMNRLLTQGILTWPERSFTRPVHQVVDAADGVLDVVLHRNCAARADHFLDVVEFVELQEQERNRDTRVRHASQTSCYQSYIMISQYSA